MNWTAQWIKSAKDMGDIAPVFAKNFPIENALAQATLHITAMGTYEAQLNGQRISEYVLAPGWTSYHARLQYQSYDVTALLQQDNRLEVTVGKGWYHTAMIGSLFHGEDGIYRKLALQPIGMIAQLELTYEDGHKTFILSDSSWEVGDSPVRFSDIYDGEHYDATVTPAFENAVECYDGPFDTLIPQEGEEIREQERVAVQRIFTTPKGETVVDFGQEVTGYVELTVDAQAGQTVRLSHAEVMDSEGNFYTENYRDAKASFQYTCRDGKQVYHPRLTFFGFRYIRVDEFPGGPQQVKPENFTAVVVHSQMKRTGRLSCSNPLLNKLFDNIIWGQKGNFLDVPTDCPQRNERLGWTGDAQVFVRTACYNFDVEKFFTKWLADLAAEQYEDGAVSCVIPNTIAPDDGSAAWGDAATICPWQVYLAYGNPEILRRQFISMTKWVDYIYARSTDYLWTGMFQYGDWLGLDAPSGSYKGSSNEELIATAYFAYSTSLVVKAGHVLGEDVSKYEELYTSIVAAFRKAYPEYKTQAECAVAVHFRLAEDCQKAADRLAQLVTECGTHLLTGFVGTPYILHALSDFGHADIAYSLLLRKEYPSWLYPVTKGATTIWEHWDGLKEDGSFWSAEMNSFNHYAYGSVADWVYGVAAGITPVEDAPGYARVRIAPIPDARLDWLSASLETRQGLVLSQWKKQDDFWRYEITTPVEAEIVIDGTSHAVPAGHYCFHSKI